MTDPVMTAIETQAYLDEVFPQQRGVFQVRAVGPFFAEVVQKIGYDQLRPGGTVSGPTLFAMADCAFYAACLAMVGREAAMVTASTAITFLRRPPEADLRAEARILKLGRSLVSGDVLVYCEGLENPVAHAAMTYSRPPAADRSAKPA